MVRGDAILSELAIDDANIVVVQKSVLVELEVGVNRAPCVSGVLLYFPLNFVGGDGCVEQPVSDDIDHKVDDLKDLHVIRGHHPVYLHTIGHARRFAKGGVSGGFCCLREWCLGLWYVVKEQLLEEIRFHRNEA